MLVDYYLIRKGNLDLSELFTLEKHGRYHFFHGFNVRAFAAFVIGFLLPLPGFAASFGHSIGIAATHMYSLGWVLSFLMGSLSYYVICLIWKVPGNDGSHAFEAQVEPAEQLIYDGIQGDGGHFDERKDVAESINTTKEAHVAERDA
jgi:NCS1 family nucleobase:cation symporter-1